MSEATRILAVMLPKQAYIIWLRYEVECEAYDRTLPGVWWGRTPEERAKLDTWMPFQTHISYSRTHARTLRLKAMKELQEARVSLEESTKAHESIKQLKHQAQYELLQELLRGDDRTTLPPWKRSTD